MRNLWRRRTLAKESRLIGPSVWSAKPPLENEERLRRVATSEGGDDPSAARFRRLRMTDERARPMRGMVKGFR